MQGTLLRIAFDSINKLNNLLYWWNMGELNVLDLNMTLLSSRIM